MYIVLKNDTVVPLKVETWMSIGWEDCMETMEIKSGELCTISSSSGIYYIYNDETLVGNINVNTPNQKKKIQCVCNEKGNIIIQNL